MRIGVFGAGYVGLVTAVCLSEYGYSIQVVETNPEKLAKLWQGINTIYEPGLTEMLARNLELGRLRFTDDAADTVRSAEVLFLCVGTPPRPDGGADLSQIESAMKAIVQHCGEDDRKTVVVKSTVPVGTAAWLDKVAKLYAKGKQVRLDVVSNPEFLREGAAVQDFMHPDRIVIGASSTEAADQIVQIYEPIDCPKMVTDSHTAEIIKYAANSFLATKISFINMVSDLCDQLGANVSQVAEGMGYDERIGRQFLRAGIGFGGSCFPKDLQAFAHIGREHNVNFGLLDEVMRVNRERPQRMIEKLRKQLWVLSGKTVAVMGLTFKPDTDDVRESPAAAFIEGLLTEGVHVKAYDPIGVPNFKQMYAPIASQVEFVDAEEDLLRDSHAAVLVTEWKQILAFDWDAMKEWMELPVILDTRNALDSGRMREIGYDYTSIGGR
jgi:UDPglucose 6-dehydrogenase